MALGPAIPTRFEDESAARLRALSKRLKMDEADLIRRSVDVALNTVEATGDYRFLIETKPLPQLEKPFTLTQVIGNKKYASKVAEDTSSVHEDSPPREAKTPRK